ncbi:hypothetical protein PENSPDRAFT_682101 [Peniophora sp. CONT]|nr:hypothetical protein PENSPDRAFT_682101 [Peniophora sp. CONT]
MPGVLKPDASTLSKSDSGSNTTKTTAQSSSPASLVCPSPSASRPLFPGLGITYEARFLRSLLTPKDPSFDAHRRTIFLNLRENTLAGWHRVALSGLGATKAEEDELVKSEMQLRAMEFGYLEKQDPSKAKESSDRTVCSIRNNQQMWRTLTADCSTEHLKDESQLRELLLRHRATEALQTQALVSALRQPKPIPFDRATLATFRDSHIQLVKAEANRLRDSRRVCGLSGDTVDDVVRRRKECEEWFGGVFVWLKDDGKSAFAFLDGWKPSTQASGAEEMTTKGLPTIRVECMLDVCGDPRSGEVAAMYDLQNLAERRDRREDPAGPELSSAHEAFPRTSSLARASILLASGRRRKASKDLYA